MILIFEQDTRIRKGKRWTWKLMFFKGPWREKTMWRIGWGFWALSYYPERGLRDFSEYIEDGNALWRSY